MRHAPLLQSIIGAGILAVDALKSQELSNTAWAFATMEFRSWPLLESIAASSIPRINRFDSQGMSNPAWAFSQRCLRNAPLFDAIASASLRLITAANSQELANFAWSNWALILRKPMLLRPEVGAFPRSCFGPTGERLVGVEWVHIADAASDEHPTKENFNLASRIMERISGARGQLAGWGNGVTKRANEFMTSPAESKLENM